MSEDTTKKPSETVENTDPIIQLSIENPQISIQSKETEAPEQEEEPRTQEDEEIDTEEDEEESDEEREHIEEAKKHAEEANASSENDETPPEIFDEQRIENPKETFLTMYQELQEEVTDADPLFKELAGITLLSLFAEKFRILENTVISFDTTKPTVGKQLNIWTIPYGRSRRTRKSTVIGIVEGVIDFFEKKYHVPINLGQEVTPQALVGLGNILRDDLKKTPPPKKGKKGFSEEDVKVLEKPVIRPKKLIWLHDEAGSVISELGNDKSYMRGFDSTASRLYDGRNYTRITQMHGFQQIESPYFVILICGTETIPESFKEESFKQGFYNRPIYYRIIDAIERPKFSGSSPRCTELKQNVICYLDALYQMTNTVSVMFLKDEPKDMINEYKNKKLDEAEAKLSKSESNRDRLRFGYYGNLENILERLSALYAIDRSVSIERITNLILKGNRAPVAIDVEDVEKAISFVERIVLTGIEDVLKIMEEHGNRKNVPIESFKQHFELVMALLKDSRYEALTEIYESAMPYYELSRRMGMAWNKFGDLMKTMEENGDLVVYPSVKTKSYKMTRLVQLQSAIKEPEIAPPIDPDASKEVEDALKRMGESKEGNYAQ